MGKILMLIDGFILKLGLLYLASHDTMTAIKNPRILVANSLNMLCTNVLTDKEVNAFLYLESTCKLCIWKQQTNNNKSSTPSLEQN